MEEEVKKPKAKRGRPLGSGRKRLTEKWEPKSWAPEYDTIVALSCIGYSYQDIQDKLKEEFDIEYTLTHIGNILNTKQAAIIKELIIKRQRAQIEHTIADRVTDITHKALERVESVMKDDQLFKESPIAIFDRAMQLLKSGKIIASEGEGNRGGFNINNAVIAFPVGMAAQLTEGLGKLQEISQVHGASSLVPVNDKSTAKK